MGSSRLVSSETAVYSKLVEVRNICAHYGRMYNRILSSEPRLYREHSHVKRNRAFAVILVIKRLLNDNNFKIM